MVFYGKIKDLAFKPENPREYLQFLEANDGQKIYIDIGLETRQRTEQQNKGSHVGFTLIANALNRAGLDIRKIMKPTVDIPWNKDSVKEYLFRPIIKSLYSKEHTSDLTKEEISEAYEILIHHLAEKHGIERVEFPSKSYQHLA